MYPYPQQKNFTTLHPHRYLAQCVKCYDADSIHAVIHFHGTPTRFRCRLLGIDTPEIRSKDPAERTHARAARDFLREGILLGLTGAYGAYTARSNHKVILKLRALIKRVEARIRKLEKKVEVSEARAVMLQRLPDTPKGDAIAKAICGGAYSIGMKRVCMNVFVRR